MPEKTIGKSLDWLQRLQALWTALPEWVRTNILGLVYAGLVAYGGRKQALMSNWTPIDSYIVAVALGTGVLIAYGWFLRLRGGGRPVVPPTTRDMAPAINRITDRQFSNDSVVVDGKSFERCRFLNVSLVYEGTGDWQFLDCRFDGTVKLTATDRAAISFAALSAYVQRQPGMGAIRMAEVDKATGQGRWITPEIPLPQAQQSSTPKASAVPPSAASQPGSADASSGDTPDRPPEKPQGA